jgi:hypothetical protein
VAESLEPFVPGSGFIEPGSESRNHDILSSKYTNVLSNLFLKTVIVEKYYG